MTISSPPVTTPDTELSLLITSSFLKPVAQTRVQPLLRLYYENATH